MQSVSLPIGMFCFRSHIVWVLGCIILNVLTVGLEEGHGHSMVELQVTFIILLFLMSELCFLLGAIQVLRNADGGGGCLIFWKKSVTKV